MINTASFRLEEGGLIPTSPLHLEDAMKEKHSYNSKTFYKQPNSSAIIAKNHAKFLDHLDTSIDTMFICARYLYDQGYTVTINAMTKAKTRGEWKNHTDKGDLEVWVDGTPQRIEVKGISTDFVDASDWKFPEFIICAAHSWDRANPKPLAYFIFNRKRTHVAIVYGKDSSTWTKIKKYDRRYTEYAQEFYSSPLDKIAWRKI